MSSERLPKAIAEETMEVMGHTLRVSFLDDGRRIIDAEDMARFFGFDTPEQFAAELASWKKLATP